MQKVHISLMESLTNTIIGTCITFCLIHFILAPGLGLDITVQQNTIVTLILTGASITKHFAIRRLFNWIAHK